MPVLGSLDYLMLYAPDVAALAGFYRDVLDGAPIEEAYPDRARLRVANIDVGLHRGTPSDGGGQPAFRVSDIAAMRAHLEAHGIVCEACEAIPGAVRMGFRDPAGNVLQVLQWGATLDSLGPQ